MDLADDYPRWRLCKWRMWLVMIATWLLPNLQLTTAEAEQRFAEEPRPQTAIIGATVVLPCQVINKVGELQWTRDDFGLGNERELYAFKRYRMVGSDEAGKYNLRISPVSLEDDAQFQCQVAGFGSTPGVRSQTAKLTVYVPPERPEILQGSTVTVTEGASIQLECVSNGGKPAAELQWWDNSGRVVSGGDVSYTAELTSDRRRSNARTTLNLPADKEHHNHVFTCAASNPALRRPLKAQIQVKVRYAPEIKITHDQPGYRDGQRATLTCSAEANPNVLTYRWYRGGQLVPGNNSTKLVIPNITRDSSGLEDIACEVSNDVGTNKEVTRINIHYEPAFISLPQDQYAGLGENVSLHCEVDSSPKPRILWMKGDRVLGEGQELYVIVTRNNVGPYQCIAQVDGFADISATARIFLKGPPKILSEREQWGNQDETVLVECIVGAAPAPSLSVTWTHNGKLVDLDKVRFEEVQDLTNEGVRHTLVIRNAQMTDFGPYKCSVHNEYGTDESEIILSKKKTLPLLLLVCGATGGVMLVLVIAMIVIMCAKKNASRHKGGKSYALPEKTISIQNNDQNSSANESDLKVEFDQRTSSSMSNKEPELDGWGPEADDHQPPSPNYLASSNPYMYPDTFTAVPVNKRNSPMNSNGGLGYENRLQQSSSPVQLHTPSPTRGFLPDTSIFNNNIGGLGGVPGIGGVTGSTFTGVGNGLNGIDNCQHFSDPIYPMYGDYNRSQDVPDSTRNFSSGFNSTLGDFNFKNTVGTLPLSLQATSRSNGVSLSNGFHSTVPRLGIPVDPNQYILSPKTQLLQGTLATHV